MKRLYWVLIIALWVLLLLASKTSYSHAAQDSVPPFPSTISVEMYRLQADGSRTDFLCDIGDVNFGCTAFCNNPAPYACERSREEAYPYADSTINVPIETYYLLDVLSQN